MAKPPPQVTLIELASVAYQPDRSTPWTHLYLARSDTRAGRVYEVRFDERAGTWACQCEAARHADCRHRRRARTLHACRWWEALYADHTPAQLRQEAEAKASMVRAGIDAKQSNAALLTIDALLLAAGEELEAA